MPLFYLPRNNTFLEITKLPRNNTVQCMPLFLLCFSGKKKKLLKKLPKEIKKLPAAEKLSKIEKVIQNVLLTSTQPLLTIYPFFDA